jgi:hypothetical protein
MSEERESLGLVAYNYEPEFTEEEMLYITTETPVNDDLIVYTKFCKNNNFITLWELNSRGATQKL